MITLPCDIEQYEVDFSELQDYEENAKADLAEMEKLHFWSIVFLVRDISISRLISMSPPSKV